MESLYECTHSLKSVIQFKYMHMFPLGLSGKGERERESPIEEIPIVLSESCIEAKQLILY